MIAKVGFNIGGVEYKLEIEEKDEMDTIHKMIVLSNPPRYCQLCKNAAEFRLATNKDKEANTYVNVRCKKCGATAKLGLYKSGGYFWHEFVKYEPKTKAE